MNHEDFKDSKKLLLSYHFDKKPLILDPDNQASAWLTKISEFQHVVFTKRTFLGAAKTVEEALKYGKVLIVLIDGSLDIFSTDILKSL